MSRKRLQEIERLSGSGSVFESDQELMHVDYRVRVVQEIIEPGAIKGLKRRKTSEPAEQFGILKLFGRSCLTLHLEDGRKLDFFVSNNSGRIAPTGKGSDREVLRPERLIGHPLP